MAAGMSHTIGVLVKGHNALSASLVKAEHSLTSFRKTAEATALSVNSRLTSPDIDTASIDKASSRLRGMGTTAMIAGGIVAAGSPARKRARVAVSHRQETGGGGQGCQRSAVGASSSG